MYFFNDLDTNKKCIGISVKELVSGALIACALWGAYYTYEKLYNMEMQTRHVVEQVIQVLQGGGVSQ